MATQAKMSFHLDAQPAVVCAAMRNPALIDESERSRDAKDVRITTLSESENTHEYEIFVVSPARGVTGIDHSKTEENRTRVKWDLKTFRGTWSWTGAHGPKVKINGTYALVPEGARTRLDMTASISVGIPLVGRVVEGKVRAGFEENWPPYVAFVRRYAAEASKADGAGNA
ncbi:MAG: DUF2505 family protein [Myxococcota bacterium]